MSDILEYITALEVEFQANSNLKKSIQQKAYMRNQFEYFGMVSEIRRAAQKPFLLKSNLPEKEDAKRIVKILWSKPQRDFQYFGQELSFKFIKNQELKDIELYEQMVVQKPWWDTIDFIAPKLIANYFRRFPEQRNFYIQKWIESNNIWLQRSAILFQLKYKDDLDTEYLTFVIHQLSNSNEFFINKAIGWILREYGKTNPNWVREFVKDNALSNLSKREALKLLS